MPFPKYSDRKERDNEPIEKFSELPIEVVYHMYDVKSLKTKNGIAWFAKFKTEDDKSYKCWMPGSLVVKYEELGEEECYVSNAGIKETSNKSYYDTKLIPYKKQDKFPTFDEMNNYNLILKFSELPVNKVFHMYNVKSLKIKNGKTGWNAEFKTEGDEYYKSWVPDSLMNKYKELGKKECYVFNGGLKENPINGRSYYDTEVEPIKKTKKK